MATSVLHRITSICTVRPIYAFVIDQSETRKFVEYIIKLINSFCYFDFQGSSTLESKEDTFFLFTGPQRLQRLLGKIKQEVQSPSREFIFIALLSIGVSTKTIIHLTSGE